MSTPEIDDAVRQLAARGIYAMSSDDWTYERAMAIVREGAALQDPRSRNTYSRYSASLADDITQATGVSTADAAAVLLYAASWVGGVALMQGLSRDNSLALLSGAAEALDRRTGTGEYR